MRPDKNGPRGACEDGLQDLRDPERRELARQYRLIPARGHERLRGEIVDLGRLDRNEQGRERVLIEQIALMQVDSLSKMVDPLEFFFRRTTDHAVNFVALFEQQLRRNSCRLGR